MKRSRVVVLALCLLLLFAAAGIAAGQENEGGASGTKVSTSTCLSGMKWTSGESGSPEMHPGRNCIDCHAKGEGPRFVASGTVYKALTEPDDCYGVEGVVVQLTDAKGSLFKMTSNKAGNFNARGRDATIAFPFTATLLFNGKERSMATPQSTANCAMCHTAKGENGAPGRIIAPGT